jgi:hypothetical protein
MMPEVDDSQTLSAAKICAGTPVRTAAHDGDVRLALRHRGSPLSAPPKFHPGRHCGELACRHSLRIRRLSCPWHDRHYRAVRQAGD